MTETLNLTIASDVYFEIERLREERKITRSELCEMLMRKGIEILKQEKESSGGI